MPRLWLAVLILLPAAASADCYVEAARRYSVNVDLLRAIGYHESRFGAVTTDNKNSNGSFDVGEMQINSSNFAELSKYGISAEALRQKRCLNINVGAWILAGFIKKHGNTWRAVGAYGAGDSVNKAAARDGYANCIREDLAKVMSGSIKALRVQADSISPAPVTSEREAYRPRMVALQ